MACLATETQLRGVGDGKTRDAVRKCKKDLSGFSACGCSCTSSPGRCRPTSATAGGSRTSRLCCR